MLRKIDEVIEDLNALGENDFKNAASGFDRLQELCDELQDANDPAACIPAMFRAMERLEDFDLGSPGPLVHTLEDWSCKYEASLAESVMRKPTPLSLWMVNRILNGDPKDASTWIAVMRSVLDNPCASVLAKEQAQRFLMYQAERQTN